MSDMTEKPYTQREIQSLFDGVHKRLSNQDSVLLDIKVQTTKTNGRLSLLERIVWGAGLVIMTVAVVKAPALLAILKVLFL